MVAPATNEAPSTLTFDSENTNFHPKPPTKRPRAWERLPKSSHSKRHKGRKVWKRYEQPLQRNPAKENQAPMQDGLQDTRELSGLVDSTHIAKRLRSRDGPATDVGPDMGQKPSRYVTTLRDKVAGTPRRKVASRRSLRLDRPKAIKPLALSVEETPVREISPRRLADEATKLELLREEEVHEVHSDPVQPTEGPLSENVEESLSSPVLGKVAEQSDDEKATPKGPDAEMLDNAVCDTEPGVVIDGAERVFEAVLDSTSPDLSRAVNHRRGPDSTSFESSPPLVEALGLTPTDSPADEHENAESPTSLVDNTEIREPQDLQSSVVTELEDEQLHDDVFSEQLIEETMTDTAGQCGSHEQEPRRCSQRLRENNKKDVVHSVATEAQSIEANAITDTTKDSVGDLPKGHDNTTIERDPRHIEEPAQTPDPQTKEDGQVAMSSGAGESSFLESVEIESPRKQKMENEVLQKTTESEFVVPDEQIRRSPRKITRSGTRFSDDTSMLKDFLSRAQARKQAKDASTTEIPIAAAVPPHRSTRKALETIDNNSSSPHKEHELCKRAGTPPGKAKLEQVQSEEVDEIAVDASPVRRSSRKRLLAPAKTATGAPSFIPVRRADGTDPVVLQKSVAQELALVTRSNTRRNKGQAKPPALILKSLGVVEVEAETKGGHALRNHKSVGWDKKLVYYQDGTQVKADAEDKQEKVEEKRPKARRLRGLGAGNGTPAPKRQMADLMGTNGTPASKSHGRKW